jgi:hypothetical protein
MPGQEGAAMKPNPSEGIRTGYSRDGLTERLPAAPGQGEPGARDSRPGLSSGEEAFIGGCFLVLLGVVGGFIVGGLTGIILAAGSSISPVAGHGAGADALLATIICMATLGALAGAFIGLLVTMKTFRQDRGE